MGGKAKKPTGKAIEVLRLLERGYSGIEISKMMGVPRQYAYDVKRRWSPNVVHGIKKRRKEVINLLDKGLTTREIAEQLGYTWGRVWHILRNHYVPNGLEKPNSMTNYWDKEYEVISTYEWLEQYGTREDLAYLLRAGDRDADLVR